MLNFADFWWSLTGEERFEFVEQNYPLRSADGSLIENWKFVEMQKEWWKAGPCFIQDKSKLINRILLKCRDAGATQIMEALESLIGVQLYTHTFVPIAAGVEKQALWPITHLRHFIEDCKYRIGLDKPLHLQAYSHIDFKEGARIEAFPGNNPKGLHGPRALWGYLDELARAQYQKELIEAFEYFFAEGGQLSILSTAYGKNNRYWQIVQHFKEFNYKRFDFLIFKNMTDFDVTKPLQEQLHLGLQCPWQNIENLERKRSGDILDNYANFRQSMCGDPLEEITQFFPDTLTHNPPVLNESIIPAEISQPNEIWIGSLDEASTVNKTALIGGQVIKKDEKIKLIIRNLDIVTGNYPIQKAKVIANIKAMNYKYFVPDATGFGGINWESELRQQCQETPILGISYGKKDWAEDSGRNNKGMMLEKTKELMQQGIIEIPNHEELLKQLSRTEKKVYTHSVEYSGKGDGKYDDDFMVALCQLCLLFYRMYLKNTELKTEISGMNIYPRIKITPIGIRYKKRTRFL